MRISDWSSDVCSSDLAAAVAGAGMGGRRRKIGTARTAGRKDHGVRAEAVDSAVFHAERDHALALAILHDQVEREILDVEVGVIFQALLIERVKHARRCSAPAGLRPCSAYGRRTGAGSSSLPDCG